RSMKIQEEIARFELEQAQAALMRTRPKDNNPATPINELSKTSASDDAPSADNGNTTWNFNILSPITGRVLRVLQQSAAVVTAGTPLLELGDPSDLEVEIDVLSRDAVKIHP